MPRDLLVRINQMDICERVSGEIIRMPKAETRIGHIYPKCNNPARIIYLTLWLCFRAARELGISHTALAKRLEMSLAGIGFSVQRGESIAKTGDYSLER